MIYTVLWQKEASDDLLALPEKTAATIVKKMESYVAHNPRKLGKPLSGQFAGLYRYHFGDYRILYEIAEGEVRIYVVRVGHRKNIYD